MTQSIIPPPELVQQWFDAWSEDDFDEESFADYVAVRAAQWGADQELEACCELMDRDFMAGPSDLRAARRPKPPGLKRVALLQLDTLNADLGLEDKGVDLSQIRRALEALPE